MGRYRSIQLISFIYSLSDKHKDSRLMFCKEEWFPMELSCCDTVESSKSHSQMVGEASHAAPVQIGLVSSQSFMIR